MNYFWAVLLQIFLISLNAVFAAAEIAVISMNEAKLNQMASQGGKKAKKSRKLAKLTADPARFLSTIQVSITLAGFLGSAFAADMFAEPLIAAILKTGIGIPASVVSAGCVILVTLILAFFNIVLGELVPKRVAMNHAEGVSTKLSGLLGAVSVVFKPLVWLLTVSTNGVLRLFGISPEDKGEDITEEDILMMAEAGSEKGNIEDEETQLIKNIFEFKDLTVGEVGTHRKDVDVLYLADGDEAWEELIHSTSHTYYPVVGETTDDVRGVLFTKAYFRLKDRSRESVLKNAVQTPVFLYENAPANTVFDKMKATHEYFAVTMDEYGGMAGIVTIHDLLEAIVGDMNDKGEASDYTLTKLEDDLWEVTGVAPLNKVFDALDLPLSEEAKDTYETFGGYLCGSGDLPEDGTTFRVEKDRMEVDVLLVENRCVTKARVRVLPEEEEDEDGDKREKRNEEK